MHVFLLLPFAGRRAVVDRQASDAHCALVVRLPTRALAPVFQFSGSSALALKRLQHWGCMSVSGLNPAIARRVCPVLGATSPR